ncbi:MAG: hypothetical protein ABIH35_04150 [Patescibacteria group bacterium]
MPIPELSPDLLRKDTTKDISINVAVNPEAAEAVNQALRRSAIKELLELNSDNLFLVAKEILGEEFGIDVAEVTPQTEIKELAKKFSLGSFLVFLGCKFGLKIETMPIVRNIKSGKIVTFEDLFNFILEPKALSSC